MQEGSRTLKRRREPQPRLSRVDTPVTGFVPSAYRHSFCTNKKHNTLLQLTPANVIWVASSYSTTKEELADISGGWQVR